MKSQNWPFSKKFEFWQKMFKSNFINFKFYKLGRFMTGLNLRAFTNVFPLECGLGKVPRLVFQFEHKILPNFSFFLLLFYVFQLKKWKSIFQPAFRVRSTQLLVKKHNTPNLISYKKIRSSYFQHLVTSNRTLQPIQSSIM